LKIDIKILPDTPRARYGGTNGSRARARYRSSLSQAEVRGGGENGRRREESPFQRHGVSLSTISMRGGDDFRLIRLLP
jgi:hypothetical protein